MNHELPQLQVGDKIEVIAPAARCSDQQLASLVSCLENWGLQCIVPPDIFGEDLLCANQDEFRLKNLTNALNNPESKAIICARGGYGSTRLIPSLTKFTQPKKTKLFIGMSDVTALHLFFQQQWQWPTLHGAIAADKFSPQSLNAVKNILFGNEIKVLAGEALNDAAKSVKKIESSITGGNLCLVQTSLGTQWQIDARKKIILLEEVGERAYKIDRMLEQLKQANIFQQADAIIFGDLIKGEEPNGSNLIPSVLKRFAENCDLPVIRIHGIGHGYENHPIPFGTKVKLELGENIKLIL